MTVDMLARAEHGAEKVSDGRPTALHARLAAGPFVSCLRATNGRPPSSDTRYRCMEGVQPAKGIDTEGLGQALAHVQIAIEHTTELWRACAPFSCESNIRKLIDNRPRFLNVTSANIILRPRVC